MVVCQSQTEGLCQHSTTFHHSTPWKGQKSNSWIIDDISKTWWHDLLKFGQYWTYTGPFNFVTILPALFFTWSFLERLWLSRMFRSLRPFSQGFLLVSLHKSFLLPVKVILWASLFFFTPRQKRGKYREHKMKREEKNIKRSEIIILQLRIIFRTLESMSASLIN